MLCQLSYEGIPLATVAGTSPRATLSARGWADPSERPACRRDTGGAPRSLDPGRVSDDGQLLGSPLTQLFVGGVESGVEDKLPIDAV